MGPNPGAGLKTTNTDEFGVFTSSINHGRRRLSEPRTTHLRTLSSYTALPSQIAGAPNRSVFAVANQSMVFIARARSKQDASQRLAVLDGHAAYVNRIPGGGLDGNRRTIRS